MNTFGSNLRISIFGESHGNSVGITLDGVPAGLALAESDFSSDLERRKSGQKGTTPRMEADLPRIMSGIFNGYSTGAPLTIMFENTNTRFHDYQKIRDIPRPGHADFVAGIKYGGFEDFRGGGHFSGRLTLGLVAAGVIAKKMIDPASVTAELIEAGGLTDIDKALDLAVQMQDSIGGIVSCRISGIPAGLGEPFFNSVESLLAHIVFSIPAIKAVEFGAGFDASKMKGSEHNDLFVNPEGKTLTNHAGGINGGITNGNDIIFRVAVKPASSISLPQETINLKTGQISELKIEGRHDLCIALRVPVVVESAAAIVIADLMLAEQKIGRIVRFGKLSTRE